MPALRRVSRGGLLALLVVGGLIAGAACTGDDDPTPGPEPTSTATAGPGAEPINLVMSDAARAELDPAATAAVADATNALAADLYAALAAGGSDNLVFSPYSAAVALAMTREGARGTTQAEMDAVLHADLVGGGDALAAGFNGFEQALAAIPGEYPFGDETLELELTTANQLFGQAGFGFDQAFLDRLAAQYGAGMRLVDYETAHEAARELINDWVSEQTHERIPALIPPGAIDDLTRLVLTNAVYLNAPWQYPFEEAATADGTFTTLDGGQVQAALMRQTEDLRYGSGDGYQLVELPYVGGKLSMLVVVPDAGSFEAVEASLDGARLAAIDEAMTRPSVTLTLPKFEFRTQSPLKGVLSELGMPTAFTDQADFSGITSEAPLLITDVLQEAFISVDEEGTEAAAATAVLVGTTSAPAEHVDVTVDRPFLFLIRDTETGAVLFMGRVMDPTAE